MIDLNDILKWCDKPINGIDLYIGDKVLGYRMDVISLNRATPNILIAGSEASDLLNNILAYALKVYDPEYFNAVIYNCSTSMKNSGIESVASVKKLFLWKDSYPAFLTYLNEEVAERESTLRALACTSIEDYQSKSNVYFRPMPRILVVVEDFDALDNIGDLLAIMRKSASLGIHFILTTKQDNEIFKYSSFMDLFPVKICLRGSEELSTGVLGSKDAADLLAYANFFYSRVENHLTLWHYHCVSDKSLSDLYKTLGRFSV